MSFNLALILTLLTLVSGVVVLLDRVFWKLDQSALGSDAGILDRIVEYSRSFFPVLLFVLVIRSFVFEPFRIPSGSMMPTLLKGDFIFVQKFAYGLRLPVLEKKFIETGEPERGDVVVFRLPSDPNINYIKRVVGLPGDVVIVDEQRLLINGEEQGMDVADDYSRSNPRFVETLGERQHDVYLMSPQQAAAPGRYTVPEGHYFVLGDNRDRSKDSRYIGPIPETHLVGEAVRIWMHMDGLSVPMWERIGQKIQ